MWSHILVLQLAKIRKISLLVIKRSFFVWTFTFITIWRSRWVYTSFALDVPLSVTKMVDTKLFNFIWRNKPHYLRKAVICSTQSEGGLNALDFKTSNIIFKIKWIQNYLRNKDCIWNIIPSLIFQQIGLEFLLKCNFDMGKIPIKCANFHKQLLLTWNLMYKQFSPS